MSQQTVDALYEDVRAVFDAFRNRLSLSDYQDTVIAGVALKAAEERQRHRNSLLTEHLLPGGTSEPKLAREESVSSSWSELVGLAPAQLTAVFRNRRLVIEEQEPSLAGALIGLDPGKPATQGDMLQLLVKKLARISFDPFTFEKSWALGALFDRIILQLAHAERRRGEYSTPPGVANLVSGLADLAPALSVHDPAAGTCRLLVDCARRLGSLRGDPATLRLSGTERNPNSWALGRIYLWSCGLDARGVVIADALTPGSHRHFDRVVCDVPAGRTHLSADVLSYLDLDTGMRLERLEDAFLALASRLSAHKGRAVIFLPQSCLFRAQSAFIRRKLIEERRLRSVVQLPAGLLFGTTVTTAVLVIDSAEQQEVSFIDARAASWNTTTGDLPSGDVDAILALMAGRTAYLPSQRVRFEDLSGADFNLTPETFLGNERGPVPVFSSPRIADQLDSKEVFLSDEQKQALEEISAGLAEGLVVNVVGPRRTGKTTVLRILREQLSGAAVVAVGLGLLERGGLVHQLRHDLSRWQGREGRLVLFLDDWDEASTVVDEEEVADFQRLIHIVMSRGPGSGVVVVSEQPIAELQTEWSREIFALSLVGTMKTVTLGSAPSLNREELSVQLRAMRNRIVHGAPIDDRKLVSELRASPLWAELTSDFGGGSTNVTRWLSTYFDSSDWERFLQELTSRGSWIRNECRALGFDAERNRGQLGAFLLRANLLPEEFIGQLLRPSDVRELLPGFEHHLDRSEAVRAAFQRWKAQESGRG
jgi:type I restriction enzyme M protein